MAIRIISVSSSEVCPIWPGYPKVAFCPVFLHGLGEALPRGEALLVPFFCDVFIGESLTWTGDKTAFMEDLTCRKTALAAEGHFALWE